MVKMQPRRFVHLAGAFCLVGLCGLPIGSQASDLGSKTAASEAPLPQREVRTANLSSDGGEDTIGGLVLDQTVTMTGHQFYDNFAAAWMDANVKLPGNLTVFERPSASWGNLIWIEMDNQIVFRTPWGDLHNHSEAIAREATAKIARRIQEQELEALLFKDPDLASSGF